MKNSPVLEVYRTETINYLRKAILSSILRSLIAVKSSQLEVQSESKSRIAISISYYFSVTHHPEKSISI